MEQAGVGEAGGVRTGDDGERAYEFVCRDAIRALDLQRASLDALRTRVGYLLSAATIATSFLGGLALRDHAAGVGSWIAIVLFGLFAAVCLRVLWPRAEGAEGFTILPTRVIQQYVEVEPPVPLAVVYRDLALLLERQHDTVRDKHLKPLSDWFRAAVILLTAETVAWVVDLAL